MHRIASDLDPGPGNPAGIPTSVLEAAKDMADYLDGERTTPESHRNGIPHAKGWDVGHALHLVEDLAHSMDEGRRSFPGHSTRTRCENCWT